MTDWTWTQEGHGWLAVLGGMLLGALIYAAGFREGRIIAASKPVAFPYPEIGGDLE